MIEYQFGLTNAHKVIITDNVSVPPAYNGETYFSMPDQIVSFCIDHFGLANNSVRVLDPLCGLGTIPRVINQNGGSCIGIEIDKTRFMAALSVSNNDTISHGDFLKVELPDNSFHCIFTSMPFDWFKNEDNNISLDYAKKMKSLLTDQGFVLLDSVPLVERGNDKWPVGLRQCNYLEKSGFTLVEIIKFQNGSDDESIVMKFISN